MYKVTVVIPNYNGINFIKDCLDSLLTCENNSDSLVKSSEIRVLVVDDNSADGSDRLVEEYSGVSLIRRTTNGGFCGAVNTGLENCDTDFVILLNNDTKVKSGFVSNLYRAILEDDRIFSVSARMLMWDDENLCDDAGDNYCILGWAYSRGKGRHRDRFDKPANVFSACGGAVIYRKSILDTIGFFDENHFAYLEDLDIGYRARINGYINRYEPSAEVIHFGSASTGSRYNPRKTVLAASNSIYVAFKNMPLLQFIINLPFLILGILVKLLFFVRKGMGGDYIKGVGIGIARCFSKNGWEHKVPFKCRNLGHLLHIEGLLLINTLKILKKS